MKILIIDDETIVRMGIRYAIPWEEYGYEIVGEASNGLEALELAKKYKPEIVLTDIVMPEMNGLDFIEKIKNELPFSKFIIFSCHDDIEFYRKAIKLGVREYIQKSCLTPQEILQAVNEIAKEINFEKIARNELKSEEINNINLIAEEEFLDFIIYGKKDYYQNFINYLLNNNINLENNGCFIIILKMHYNDEETAQNYNGEYNLSIVNICKNIFKNNKTECNYLFLNDKNNFLIIITFKNWQYTQVKKYLEDVLYRVRENINQMFGIIVTFAISNEIKNFIDINQGFKNAMNALENYYTHGLGKFYFYNDIEKELNNNLKDNNENNLIILNEIKNIYKTNLLINSENIIESLLKIEKFALEHYGISIKYLKSLYMDVLYYIINFLRKEEMNIEEIMEYPFNAVDFIENSKTLRELNNKIILLIDKIKDYYLAKIYNKEKLIILKINQYINEHLYEQIKLENIAKIVHLNSSYISRLYKKETGKNIKDYIISLKIDRSKELIISGCSANEIINKIGFFSESHFFKLFKKHTGLTPKQFKEFIKQKL